MTEKLPPITDAQRNAARADIERLIASPPVRTRTSSADAFPESAAVNSPMAKQALDSLRRKLAADRGMTLEQWLELEAEVSHPRELVPVTLTPRVLARRRMLAAKVPDKYITDVADSAPLECEPLKQVRAFLDGRDAFRVLSGGKGVRKTGSACWALGQLDRGTFVEAADLIGISISKPQRWDELLAAPLIVLDDLGWEKRTDTGAFEAAFSKLLNTVYSHGRRMIITCNMPKETFAKVYGEREYDRLREVGKWSYIAGESVRAYHQGTFAVGREPGEEG